jgi:hypothetical protein
MQAIELKMLNITIFNILRPFDGAKVRPAQVSG